MRKALVAVVLVFGMLTLVDDCGGDFIVRAAPQPATVSWHAHR